MHTIWILCHTYAHVTHKVNRNKSKTLCAEYMCDIEIYVPHTCVTWILYHIYIYTCHTYIYLNKYKTLKYYKGPKAMCGIYV